jgi:DNA polymerase kappa
MNDMELLSQEAETEETLFIGKHGKEIVPNPISSSTIQSENEREAFWSCPICDRPQPAEEKALNDHIDQCLSRSTIKEAVKDLSSVPTPASTSTKSSTKAEKLSKKTNGKRKHSTSFFGPQEPKQRKLFG